ncbi:ribokinase [Rhodococcoides trifolii]|uniref:ribokinase n=1 Tax=Rhodococcoides trifolii TaxID=908250 RepID=UPI0016688EF1|nr:ribokinase [Rhodococcus trifolii]
MSTEPPLDVLVVGSLNADLIVRTERFPRGGETVHGDDLIVGAGGKSANQAVAASRLGSRVAMIGAVGDDAHADIVLASLDAAAVDITRVERIEDAVTGTAVITVDAAGENTIVVSAGANGRLAPASLDRHLDAFDGVRVVCLCLEAPLEVVRDAARRGRDAGARILVNLSPFEAVTDLLEPGDVLLVNEHELELLVDGPVHDWTDVVSTLATLSIRTAVVTRGARGAVVLDADGDPTVVIVPAPSVEPVDTTGAGDAFTGALAARLAAGESLSDAATYAARVGAYATLRVGTQSSYPDLSTLEGWAPEAP